MLKAAYLHSKWHGHCPRLSELEIWDGRYNVRGTTEYLKK